MDGERLALVDWQGSRRLGAAQTNCGGDSAPGPQRGRAGAPGGRGAGAAGPPGGGQQGPEAFFGGRGGTPMRTRAKTTAGAHWIGATFPATNFAPLLDLDQHFMRDTLQTGPTPGFTFFPHVGTVRIEGPFSAVPAKESPSRARIFLCRPAAAADEPACTRTITTALATRAFRRPASPGDLQALMPFYQSGRQDRDFEHGVEMVLARIMADPRFIYRIETEPAHTRPNQPYRISDLELASRLSFFLWSSVPDDQLIAVASQGTLRDPAVLEQQVQRMLKDPRSEALTANFAGQWLNLRGLQGAGPLPMVYPDFDDPLRQAMRCEVELLFDSIIREDRSVLDLLTGDDTFVNERLAKHYGIPNVYGSRLRRVTLPPEMDVRRGLLGKGAFLTTTSKPERTSPVTRGKWIMTNILGVSPPDPPPDVPPLPSRSSDAADNLREPTMRQKMVQHRVRSSSVPPPDGSDRVRAENFDGIGRWRTTGRRQHCRCIGTAVRRNQDRRPAALRQWLLGYSTQFVQVVTEKLLVYALGRAVGCGHAARAIDRA
jgi:hypothetical protein